MKIDGIPVEGTPLPFPPGARDVSTEGGFTEAGAFKIKWLPLKAGEVAAQHIHEYPHATFIISGVIRLFVEGENLGVFYPMESIYVEAGKRHYLHAETDSVFACIHYIED